MGCIPSGCLDKGESLGYVLGLLAVGVGFVFPGSLAGFSLFAHLEGSTDLYMRLYSDLTTPSYKVI